MNQAPPTAGPVSACTAHRFAVFGLAAVRTSLQAYLEVRRDPYHSGLLDLVDSLLAGACLLHPCECDLCMELRESTQ